MERTLAPRRSDGWATKTTPPGAATPLPDVSDRVIDAILRSFGGGRRDGAASIARSTAIHEAGQVVSGVVVHGPNQIEFATIEPPPGGELNGFVRFRALSDVRPRWNRSFLRALAAPTEADPQFPRALWVEAQLRAVGIRSYAGVVAQCCAPFAEPDDVQGAEIECLHPGSRWCRPENLSLFVDEHSEHDRETLARVASMFRQRIDVDAWIPAHWRDAKRLLSRRWDRVHAVAAALLTEGTVHGEVLDSIVLQGRGTL